MKILLLGAGGREHALMHALRRSSCQPKVYCVPDHPAAGFRTKKISPDILDFPGLARLIEAERIEMVVPGSEVPLVHGVRDYIEKKMGDRVQVVGPHARAARLEGSKVYAKAFMRRHSIPTARAESFSTTDRGAVRSFLETLAPPYVLKEDGLAGGKGVHIVGTKAEALRCLEGLSTRVEQVVIEEFLEGEELSFFVLARGEEYLCLPNAKDYKRVGDGDTGPNTGGMGAFSPGLSPEHAGIETEQKIIEQVVAPTLRGLAEEGVSYEGFLFFGLMLVSGTPYVLEYNVRMGDPETQAILPRLQSDWVEVLKTLRTGGLRDVSLAVDPRKSVTLVLASAGYPGAYETQKLISGLGSASSRGIKRAEEVHISLAGVRQRNGQYYTSGGRVLMITALSQTLKEAAARCYERASSMGWEGAYYRKDIGQI